MFRVQEFRLDPKPELSEPSPVRRSQGMSRRKAPTKLKAMNSPHILFLLLCRVFVIILHVRWSNRMLRVRNLNPKARTLHCKKLKPQNAGLVHVPWLASCGPAHEPPQNEVWGFGCRG